MKQNNNRKYPGIRGRAPHKHAKRARLAKQVSR